jgi:hypothetical protein
METESVQVKIKLGNLEINAHQRRDGSYAASGLFRLTGTEIYRYGECWYWLGCDGVPDVKKCKFWDSRGDVFLAFQVNKLCYLYVNPIDPERKLYVPIPPDLQSVMEFCVIGKIVSDKAMLRLVNTLDRLCPVGKGFVPALRTAGLLKDTAIYLPKVEASVTGARVAKSKVNSTPPCAKIKKTSSTPKKPTIQPSIYYDGFIYLVRLDAHLKLGFTRNVGNRLKSFETTNARVELIKLVHGDIQNEKHLHSILGSKVRELYDFKDRQRIIRAMMDLPRAISREVRYYGEARN